MYFSIFEIDVIIFIIIILHKIFISKNFLPYHFSFFRRCLGTHPPAYGRLPPNTLVLHISGSYFSAVSIDSKVASENFIPRYLHIGTPDDCQVNLKSSYLLRLVILI